MNKCANCGMDTDNGPHCRHCKNNGLIVPAVPARMVTVPPTELWPLPEQPKE